MLRAFFIFSYFINFYFIMNFGQILEALKGGKKAIKKACKTHPQRKELCYNIVRVEDGQVVFSFNSKWGDSEFD